MRVREAEGSGKIEKEQAVGRGLVVDLNVGSDVRGMFHF